MPAVSTGPPFGIGSDEESGQQETESLDRDSSSVAGELPEKGRASARIQGVQGSRSPGVQTAPNESLPRVMVVSHATWRGLNGPWETTFSLAAMRSLDQQGARKHPGVTPELLKSTQKHELYQDHVEKVMGYIWDVIKQRGPGDGPQIIVGVSCKEGKRQSVSFAELLASCFRNLPQRKIDVEASHYEVTAWPRRCYCGRCKVCGEAWWKPCSV